MYLSFTNLDDGIICGICSVTDAFAAANDTHIVDMAKDFGFDVESSPFGPKCPDAHPSSLTELRIYLSSLDTSP